MITPEGPLAIQSTLEPIVGMPLLEGYPSAFKVVPRADHYDLQGHLNNVSTVRIFQDIRIHYMGTLVGARRLGLIAQDHVFGVRELVTSYVSEARPGEQLYGGCRVLGRSRRSWLFDEVLATEDRVVARARLIECAIRGGQAVEIPDDFWRQVEVVEGRELPIRELPMGRTPWDET